MNITRLAQFGMTLALLAAVGCGDGRTPRVPVSGKVMVGDKPLHCGFVRFFPKDDRAASARIQPDGSFTLSTYDPGDGAVVGKHQVTVVARDETRKGVFTPLIPERYLNPKTSGLEVEITGPTNDVVLHLEPLKARPSREEVIDSTGDDDPMNWEKSL